MKSKPLPIIVTVRGAEAERKWLQDLAKDRKLSLNQWVRMKLALPYVARQPKKEPTP